MSSATLQLFRSCTASLSSRSLARSSALSHPRQWQRHYSDVKPEEAKTNGGEESEAKPEGTSGKEGHEDGTEKLSPEAVKLKAKEDEVADLKSRLRYLQADFINLQHNAAREKEQTRDFAITRFASDLLDTVDVLSLALKSIPSAVGSPSDTTPSHSHESKTHETYLRELYTGVELTQRQLLHTLFKYHIKPFDPTGDVFDPNRHEALYQATVPDKEPGTVIDCQKTGYLIKDRVLRAAQVGVAQDP